MPRDAGEMGWGFVQKLTLEQPLNTNTVNRDIYPVTEGGPAIKNNGINRDGGVTELYEVQLDSPLGSDSIYACSNGKFISVDSTGAVWGAPDGVNYSHLGQVNAYFFNRYSIGPQFLDAAATTDRTIVTARIGTVGVIIIEEWSANMTAILHTESLAVGQTPVSVCICRSTALTFTSLIYTSGLIFSTGSGAVYQAKAAGTTHIGGMGYLFDYEDPGIVAYYNGGTIVYCGLCQIDSNGRTFTLKAPYITASLLQFAGPVTVDGVSLAKNHLLTFGGTLTLGAATTNVRVPAFLITITAGGIVTTSTGYGTYYNGDGGTITAANFKMEDGIVTPYGCCGVCSDGAGGAGTNFGTFHITNYLANTPAATKPKQYPQLIVRAENSLCIKSYNGQIAIITVPDSNNGNIVNDYAGGGFDYDLMAGNPFNGTTVSNLLFPISSNADNGSVCVYKLNNGGFVSVVISSNATNAKYAEIAPGVVQLNTTWAKNSIVDTNEMKLYTNYSAYVPSFFFNATTTTYQTFYLKIFNKYSSSLDQGLMYADKTVIDIYYPTPVGWSQWDGQTGIYIGDVVETGTPIVTAKNIQHAGTYVFNANIPPGCDSTFSGGGIQMLNATAIATQSYNGSNGYWGYYLFPSTGGSNLLPFKTASIFLIQGTYYAFDGTYIYGVVLSNGSTGVVVGAPVRVCYAVGLEYLCVSETRAYFKSPYDNAVFTFDGGRSLAKFAEFNQKPIIESGYYSTRDNALYLVTESSVITVREPEDEPSVNIETLQITENTLPAYTAIQSTANGLMFVDNTYGSVSVTFRTYYEDGGTLIPLDWQTAYVAPEDGQTMQIGRYAVQVYLLSGAAANFTLTHHYTLVDGTQGSESQSFDGSLYPSTTLYPSNTLYPGYQIGGTIQNPLWISWTPPHSNVLASSLELVHNETGQRIVVLEVLLYYKTSSEVMPLVHVTA